MAPPIRVITPAPVAWFILPTCHNDDMAPPFFATTPAPIAGIILPTCQIMMWLRHFVRQLRHLSRELFCPRAVMIMWHCHFARHIWPLSWELFWSRAELMMWRQFTWRLFNRGNNSVHSGNDFVRLRDTPTLPHKQLLPCHDKSIFYYNIVLNSSDCLVGPVTDTSWSVTCFWARDYQYACFWSFLKGASPFSLRPPPCNKGYRDDLFILTYRAWHRAAIVSGGFFLHLHTHQDISRSLDNLLRCRRGNKHEKPRSRRSGSNMMAIFSYKITWIITIMRKKIYER